MAIEPNAVEQAVSRTLRENLQSIQRTADEVHRAVGDLVAACASNRSLNALSPMIRAQMAASSLSATLDVLARLITVTVQPGSRAAELEPFRLSPSAAPEPLTASTPPDSRFVEPRFAEPRFAEPRIPDPIAEPIVKPISDWVPTVTLPVPNLPLPEIATGASAAKQSHVAPEMPATPPASPPPSPSAVVEHPIERPVEQRTERSGEHSNVQPAVADEAANDQIPKVQTAQQSPVEKVIELMVEAFHNSGALHVPTQDTHVASSAPEPPTEIFAEPVPAPPLMEPVFESTFQPVAVSHATEDDSLWTPGPELTPEFIVPPSDVEAAASPLGNGDEPESATEKFDISLLPVDQQELHRRANRVAKVSMQDIKMLRPEDVRLGRANRDLCYRLRDDIEKAHKEYERRFQSIQSHPVDYFYNWMVEILGGGKSEALGEYPYPTAVLHR